MIKPERIISTNEARLAEEVLPYCRDFSGHLVLYPTFDMVAQERPELISHIVEKYPLCLCRIDGQVAERLVIVLLNPCADDVPEKAIILGRTIEFIPCILEIKDDRVTSIEHF